uniref:Chitin-binding type-2 domain-containing protein n=1 Tax=Strigamia maritima TaxID=126957 RepID=T1IWV0_STRMM
MVLLFAVRIKFRSFNTKIKIKGQDRNFCANDCNHDNVHYRFNEDRINISTQMLQFALIFLFFPLVLTNKTLRIQRSIDGRHPRPIRCTDECSVSCPNYVNNLVLLAHPRDCTKFFYCVFGQPIVYVCPEELHFNPLLLLCDWPERAGCWGRVTVKPPPEMPPVIESTTCRPKPKPVCRPKPKPRCNHTTKVSLPPENSK